MNQMLTIIREQDRAMRDSIRDVERTLNRNSPTLNSYVPAAPQQNSGMQSQTASENTYTIPYAPPRPPPPSWRPNLSPLRRPVYPDPVQYKQKEEALRNKEVKALYMELKLFHLCGLYLVHG